MSASPMVYAVCLTADRQTLTNRAVKSFLAQTYTPRRLLLLDSGVTPYDLSQVTTKPYAREIQRVELFGHHGHTIGALRNTAADLCLDADILVHWDSDDWSSPHRIREQVKTLLNVEGQPRLITGYNALVFWDSTRAEAWEYRQESRADYGLGTSLAYWREAWRARPFQMTSRGEELEFTRGRCHGESAIPEGNVIPQLVAAVHGGNTSTRIIDTVEEWTRAPGRDEKIGRLMALAL